jgi:hypothetical protein
MHVEIRNTRQELWVKCVAKLSRLWKVDSSTDGGIYVVVTECVTEATFLENLDGWLTVLHRSITLVDLQIDAQNSYLFTYNTFIKILYMFRTLPCSSSGGLRRNCIYAASGIVTVCR